MNKNILEIGAELDPASYLSEVQTCGVKGVFAIAAHPFARTITNDQLFQLAIRYGLPTKDEQSGEGEEDLTKKIQGQIKGPGFKARHLSQLPGEEFDYDRALVRQARVSAYLLEEAMREMGWNGIDAYFDASAFLPLSFNQRVLQEAGLINSDIVTQPVRMACAGSLTALMRVYDFEPGLKRVVIGSSEPLSWLMSEEHFRSRQYLDTPALFSDGNSAIGLVPNRLQFTTRHMMIRPDEGVIRLNPDFKFAELPEGDQQPIPSYYHFAENGREILHYSRQGIVLKHIPPENNTFRTTINGQATLKFFGKHTPDVIAAGLEQQGETRRLNARNYNIIIHPASKPVIELINKRSSKIFEEPMPLLIDEAGLANSSSATLPNYWLQMLLTNRFDPSLPILMFAPGIGSGTAVTIGKIVPGDQTSTTAHFL